jgi:hypothetical protein
MNDKNVLIIIKVIIAILGTFYTEYYYDLSINMFDLRYLSQHVSSLCFSRMKRQKGGWTYLIKW